MLFKSLSFVVSFLFVVFSISFYTLLERKILSLSQTRIGPNKTSFKGLLQPIMDGVKLIVKEEASSSKKVSPLFYLSPVLAFLVMMMLWQILPSFWNWINLPLSSLIFLMLMGVSAYSTILAGWSSFSKFGLLGAIRSCAQTISYEISLAIVLIFFLFFTSSFCYWLTLDLYLYLFIPLGFVWWFSAVVETNRAPFDFSEGESELISGFNIEFTSIGFTLLFLAEYGNMLFFSFFIATLFFKASILAFIMVLTSFLVFRATFPRYRYDKLMKFMWMKILPLLCWLFLVFLFISSVSLFQNASLWN